MTVPVADIILIGLGTYGGDMARRLLRHKKQVVGVDFDPEVVSAWQDLELPVFYGDIGDPEILEHLPLTQTRLVVVTVRDVDLNLSLVKNLRAQGYRGKVALTARHEDEVRNFLAAGADMVLRPFADAAEQAADALAATVDVLASDLDWLVALRIFRLESGSLFAGRKIRDIPLRPDTGVLIVAINRAGQTLFDPDPDQRVYPGDRLVLSGEPEALAQAETYLQLRQIEAETLAADRFSLAHIAVADDSPLLGQTLAEVKFREKYRVTVIGIRRGENLMMSPPGGETFQAGDRLIIAGKANHVQALEQSGPL